MIVGIKFKFNESLFNRDPQNTELGKKIIQYSVILINEIGLEAFNFKKLAERIESTEASIYRYFENKHSLLLFLTSWYWEWVHYLIDVNTKNIDDPKRKLKIAIQNIVQASEESSLTDYVNENLLHRIIVNEGSKAYHTHSVDAQNKNGLFLSYKELVEKVASIINEVNPDFKYKNSLASNLFEMSNNQRYFAEHLPRLTDIQSDNSKELLEMMEYFVLKLLKK